MRGVSSTSTLRLRPLLSLSLSSSLSLELRTQKASGRYEHVPCLVRRPSGRPRAALMRKHPPPCGTVPDVSTPAVALLQGQRAEESEHLTPREVEDVNLDSRDLASRKGIWNSVSSVRSLCMEPYAGIKMNGQNPRSRAWNPRAFHGDWKVETNAMRQARPHRDSRVCEEQHSSEWIWEKKNATP